MGALLYILRPPWKWDIVSEESDIMFNWGKSGGRKSDFGTNFAKAERRGGRDGEENDTFHQRANLSIGTRTHPKSWTGSGRAQKSSRVAPFRSSLLVSFIPWKLRRSHNITSPLAALSAPWNATLFAFIPAEQPHFSQSNFISIRRFSHALSQ